MKKIVMKTLLAGPDGALAPGQEVSMPDERADSLVKGGYAQYAGTPVKVEKGKKKNEEETATAEAPEDTGRKLVKRRKAGRKR